MKSSGFDIEKTHLSDTKRIEKLILLIMVAFVWAYKVGIKISRRLKSKNMAEKQKQFSILINDVFVFYKCTNSSTGLR